MHSRTDLDLKWHGALMGQARSGAPPPPARGSLVPASSGRILTHRGPHATHLLQLLAMLGGGHWTCGAEKEFETLWVLLNWGKLLSQEDV